MPSLAAVLLAASCAPAVLLSPEAADLKSAVESAAPKGTRVLVEGQLDAGKNAPRNVLWITSTPGWNVPSGAGPEQVLPLEEALKSRYSIPSSLEKLGRRPDGRWSAVPLLYDVLGKTAFVVDGKSAPPSGDWGTVFAKADKRSIAVAGARPSFRQALYSFMNPVSLPEPDGTGLWFSLPAKGRPDPSAVFAAPELAAALLPDAWNYSRADLLNQYKSGSKLAFIETYRDYELANPPGFRRFSSLGSEVDGRLSVAGIILFAEFRGDKREAKAAAKIAASLAAPQFQKAAGLSGKWLGANREAPEIDLEGAQSRHLAERAAVFFPLTDRLPEPPVEGLLIESIQFASPARPGK